VRRFTRSFAFLFLAVCPAIAQLVAFGVEGGLRTSGDVSGSLTPESKRYIVGPKLEVRLPLHLSFEVDALYRRIGFTGYESSPFFSAIRRERDNSWEFPMIGKYHFPGTARLGLHPFAGIGYAQRTLSGSAVSSGSYLNVGTGVTTYYSNSHSTVGLTMTQGLVISGGVELGARHLLISPELRYVHWNAPVINSYGGDGSFSFAAPQDELFVLVGIAWH
jgi:hypothetical protein